MKIKCGVCSRTFEAKRPSAKYCGATCRQRARRAGGAAAAANDHVPLTGSDEDGQPLSLIEVVKRDLDEAGRVNTVAGQAALNLAYRIMSPLTTGSAVTGLTKELRATMAEALAGAKAREPDVVDELEARRLAKVQAAS